MPESGMAIYLKEPTDEVLRQTRPVVLLSTKVLHHVGQLFPEVECFLIRVNRCHC